MSMTIGEASAANTLIQWVTGQHARYSHRGEITNAEADKAARTLITKAHKVLSAGLFPEDVDLTRVVAFNLADDGLYFVLSEALEDWAAAQREKAKSDGGNETREHWADVADNARERVKDAFLVEAPDVPVAEE
jgi:hypothetical protein